MSVNLGLELDALQRMTVGQLQARYAEVFGEHTPANNKVWLRKRIAWRLQALAEGDLSERARRRAAEIGNDADIRMNPPRLPPAAAGAGTTTTTAKVPREVDERLPPPGTLLTRQYKGESVQVRVLPDGFEYAGQIYRSLSAVAKAVTGSHCNGFLFFKLTGQGGEQ